MNKRQPTIDEMIATERREALIALRHLSGESIDSEPLYFRGRNGESILTYAGALNLADLLGIERVNESFKQAPQSNGKVAYFAVVKCQLGTNTRRGAAVSRHPQVACELAFRNGVKQIMPGLHSPHKELSEGIMIRRIDRSPRGESRWKEAQKVSNMIASLVPDRDDIDWTIPQPSFEGLEELAIETLMEGI